MPKRLPARWRPESIREFRASAWQRFEEGMSLAAAGHRTGAIYLWGYAAEMTLKAAYFALLGRAEIAILTWAGDILPAINDGRGLGIVWPVPGQGHNVRAWAELLVVVSSGDAGDGLPVTLWTRGPSAGQSIGQLWSESLRYHNNMAYVYEMNQVLEAAEWLLLNLDVL